MKCNRCVDITVGLQAGSEGKGGLVSVIAPDYKALVRTGGPNAAHTVYFNGHKASFHQIPCGALHAPDAKLILGANAQIDIEYLVEEIALLKKHDKWLDSNGKVRLIIDPQATIIDPIDKIAENGGRMPDCGEIYFHPRDCEIHNTEFKDSIVDDQMIVNMISVERARGKFDSCMVTKDAGTCMGCPMLPKDSAWSKLGSTTHGAGANLIRKIARGTKIAVMVGQRPKRKSGFWAWIVEWFEDKTAGVKEFTQKFYEEIEVEPVRLANDDEFLQQFIGDTVQIMNRMIDDGEAIMLEGTQGAMLSLHHSYYPKCTSRDTNAANWCSDAGISPLAVRNVFGVARTFPIRVAGASGPLSGTEIDWDEVAEHATEKPIKKWRRQLSDIEDILKNGTFSASDTHTELEYAGKRVSEWRSEAEDLRKKIKEVEIVEVTTATKRKRRVFLFGEDDFKKAIDINRPNCLTLTFVDYLNIEDFGKASWDSLSQRTRDWITTLESKMGVFFKYLSTGPKPEHTIIRKTPGELVAQVQSGHE